MKFREIYENAIKYWPVEIDISDGKIIVETAGFRSDNLSKSWDIAEERSANEWESLMAWIIFGALHEASKRKYMEGKSLVNVSEAIELPALQKSYLEALQEEGYEEMLLIYSSSNLQR